jgi:hypothetical protein
MLLAHLGHVFEEIWGRFWILQRVGLGWYLAINWALFSIPLALLFCVLNRKRLAYRLGVFYAGFMGLQGIGHNIAAIVTGRYFDGYAGGVSGIAMFLLAWPLIHALRKELPGRQGPEPANP